MVKIVKLLLYPFAVLYDLVTRIRNHLYDIRQKPSFQFDREIIVVGNLNVGGSGKTPMIEYIVRLLKDQFLIATLSRGYKRQTKGFRIAQSTDSARSIGDEPFQLFRKFGSQVNVTVGEDRVFAIPFILQEFPETDAILLDDAFQHRSVRPHLSILVTDYAHPFYNDFLMPMGYLREARSGAKRADVIVVTKCDESLSNDRKISISNEIKNYADSKPVFFSAIRYVEPVQAGNQIIVEKNIVLVSGIANTTQFEEFCKSNYTVIKHFNYSDHHSYSVHDLNEIELFCKSQSQPISIVTTEKDYVKFLLPDLKHFLDRLPWFYLPIEQYFLEDGAKFDALILRSVRNVLSTE